MSTVLAFSGSFALSYFAPMILGPGKLWVYFSKNPTVQIALCTGATVLYNAWIVWNNSKKKQVVEIEHVEGSDQLRFQLISQYSSAKRTILKELDQVQIEVKDIGIEDINQSRAVFFKDGNGRSFGTIFLKREMWAEHEKTIQQRVKRLRSLKKKAKEGQKRDGE
ncbi:MAG: hypothetical protein ABEH38_09100 [Flavobacteriales bacterium]